MTNEFTTAISNTPILASTVLDMIRNTPPLAWYLVCIFAALVVLCSFDDFDPPHTPPFDPINPTTP